MDWSVLGCSRRGHLTFAPDEPELRAQMGAQLPGGTAWQCLRCGCHVAGPPARSGPAASAPVVRRGREIRSGLVLRLFAVERLVRAIVAAAVSVALLEYVAFRDSIQTAMARDLPVVRDVFRELGFNVTGDKVYVLVQHALTLSTRTVALVAAFAIGYALLEVAEGVGLWIGRRWGEYLAMIATSLGLPLEIWDLTRTVSVTDLILLGLNVGLVVYLVAAKRLFGLRGGKAAFEARLASESVLQAAARTAASAAGRPDRQPANAGGSPAPVTAASLPQPEAQ